MLYRSNWIDLHRVTAAEAQAFGRNPNPRVPTLVATCAWFEGAPGFGLRSEIVTFPGEASVTRVDRKPERRPRICVGNEVEPEELLVPLRQLISLCGGVALPAKR